MSRLLNATPNDPHVGDEPRSPRDLLRLNFANFSPKMRAILEQAAVLAASGFFPNAKRLSEAAAKMMLGAEMGFAPMASITNVHVIAPDDEDEDAKKSVMIGAHLMAAAIDKSPDHDFEIKQLDDEACEIDYYRRNKRTGVWELRGTTSFGTEEATVAGLLNRKAYKKWRPDMYYARTMARGFRRHCAALMGGVNAYAPEELDFVPNEEGTGWVRDPDARELESDAIGKTITMPRRASESRVAVEIVRRTDNPIEEFEGDTGDAALTLRVGDSLYNLRGENAAVWFLIHGTEQPVTCTGPGCVACAWQSDLNSCAENGEHAKFVGPHCPTCAATPPEGTT